MKLFIKIISLFFLLTYATTAWSSETKYVDPTEQKNFDEVKWSDLIDGLEYKEKIDRPKEKEKEKKKKPPPSTWFNEALWAGIFKIFAIVSGIILALFILYYLVNSSNLFQPKSKNIDTLKKDFDIEEIEENLEEANVDSFLALAIANKQYTLAIRLYYLSCIKKMSENNLVKWKRDKTNRNYINELGGHELAPSFRELTPIFERIWYGNKIVDESTFRLLQPKFQRFIDSIKPTPPHAK